MKTRKNVELPPLDLIWFQEAYPKGSLSWILTMLLHEFRQIHEEIGATPKKIAKDAAKSLKSSIDDGIFLP